MLPDDGLLGPKHVGVFNFNILISVKSFKSRRMRWAGHVARMGEERGGV